MTEVDVAAPAVSPEAFAVSPELAADAFRRLSQVQDTVGQMVRRARVLGRSVPLGGGYAGEVGEFMARYGLGDTGSAVEALTRFGRELEDLKLRIEAALRRYDEQDRAAVDGMEGMDGADCVGGG